MNNLPLFPTIQASIDEYYPGTKLAISEYNFGGENISGTIAEAEALGCFADTGVYLATIWGGNDCQFAGIRLFINYDGDDSMFGDTLISTTTDDVSFSSAYAAMDDDRLITLIITNKDSGLNENAVIDLTSSHTGYTAAAVYAVYDEETYEIQLINVVESTETDVFEIIVIVSCILLVCILIYQFPVYRLLMVCDTLSYYNSDEISMLVSIGSLSDRIEAQSVLRQADAAFQDCKHTDAERGELYGLLSRYATPSKRSASYVKYSLELWSAHLGDTEGYIWVYYSKKAIDSNGDTVSASLRCEALWKVEKNEDGIWKVVSIRELPRTTKS